MRKLLSFLMLLLVSLVILQPVLATASEPIRLIPIGCASTLSGNDKGRRICSDTPLPEGVLMLCEGQCVIQTRSTQLIAQDKTMFAFSDGGENWHVTVEKGRVDFVLCPDKPIAFLLPNFPKNTPPVVPSSNKGVMVRGYVTVVQELGGTTQLVMQDTSEDCNCVAGSWADVGKSGSILSNAVPYLPVIPPLLLI